MVGELKRSLSWRALKKPIRAFQSWTHDSSTSVFCFSNKKTHGWLCSTEAAGLFVKGFTFLGTEEHVQSSMYACLWVPSSIYTIMHSPPCKLSVHRISYGETLSFNTELSQKKNTKEQINVFHKLSTAHKTNPRNIDFHVSPAKRFGKPNNVQMFPWTARETWIATSIYTAVKGLGVVKWDSTCRLSRNHSFIYSSST